MEGDTTDWGWQLGAAWQINDDHRIGAAYKSEVDLTLKGHAEGLGFGLAPNQKRNGSMDLPLPATFELASYHQLTEQWAMHASFNWTNWSAFENSKQTSMALLSLQWLKSKIGKTTTVSQ
ncbi:long-chain fatty acid transport protein [Vibrio astriarenae]|nr:long-chain fatty acid transport protein [Vibrio sp. C7]